MFRAYYVLPDSAGTTRAHSLEQGKSKGSQATVKQPLIDIDVVHQQLLEGAPKIGQIPP